MAKNTIKFEDGAILLNGTVVGYLEGRGEVYVTFIRTEGPRRAPVARFKYRAASASAKSWVKCVLTHYTVAQIIETLAWDQKNPTISPAEFARQKGWVSPNELRAQKLNATYGKTQAVRDAAARTGTPVIDLPLVKADASAFIGEIKIQTLTYIR